MSNLIRTEWYKLRKDRSFRTMSGLLFAFSVLFPLLVVYDAGTVPPKVSEFYTGILGQNNYIIWLIPCILAGFFISSEYSIGTMKSIAASGNSRIRIFFAKLIIFTIGAMIISLIFPLVMTGAGSIYFGFHDMPEFTFYLQTIGLIMLYACSFASIMAVFSTIFTDSGKTIGFSFLFFMLIETILEMLGAKIAFFEPVYNYSVFKLLPEIGNINSMDGSEWLTLLLVPILTFVAFGLLGSWIFQKKEIK